jgi:hypothetical protein
MSSMAKINWGVVLGLLVCYLIAFSLAIAAEQHRSKVQNSNTNLSCHLMKEDTFLKYPDLFFPILYNGIHNSKIDIVVCLFDFWRYYCTLEYCICTMICCLFRGCLKHSWGWKSKWYMYHSTSASSTLIVRFSEMLKFSKRK